MDGGRAGCRDKDIDGLAQAENHNYFEFDPTLEIDWPKSGDVVTMKMNKNRHIVLISVTIIIIGFTIFYYSSNDYKQELGDHFGVNSVEFSPDLQAVLRHW